MRKIVFIIPVSYLYNSLCCQIFGKGNSLDVSKESLEFDVAAVLGRKVGIQNPIFDTRISVRVFVCLCVTLRGPPLDSETGWTGELWSNPVLLILEN